MAELINHLWQSTLFTALVALSALALRRNQAKIRYWFWLAASAKFLIPFSLLLSLGTRVPVPAVAPGISALAVEQLTATFAPVPRMADSARHSNPMEWQSVLLAIWMLGTVTLILRWSGRWLTLRATVAEARPLAIAAPIPVLSSAMSMEPGIFGICRPVLLLPDGIAAHLSAAELDAILAHELWHVVRRDNLTAALHMMVEALFWFHPATWWIGKKLVEERERACDDAVLRMGKQPQVYASGILNVCKRYLASPVDCAAGVGSGMLKRRIEEIMTWRPPVTLTPGRKLALSSVLIAALVTPIAIGILRAQTLPPPPQFKFEVASIRPSKAADSTNRLGPGPQGGLRAENVTALRLIAFAYSVRPFQIAGGPGWASEERFNINATPDYPETAPTPDMPREKLETFNGKVRQRLQALLMERFDLVLRAETREIPVYGLVIGKGGHKLNPTPEAKVPNMSTGNGRMTGTAADMKMLSFALAGLLRRPVVDETGLAGLYDLSMEWAPDSRPGDLTATEENGPSIFTAIQEQLGLKLESKKAPAPVFVIEKIGRPSEN